MLNARPSTATVDVLTSARRDVVRGLHVLARRREVGGARDVVDEVADRRLDARPGEELLRVLRERRVGEVVRERRRTRR